MSRRRRVRRQAPTGGEEACDTVGATVVVPPPALLFRSFHRRQPLQSLLHSLDGRGHDGQVPLGRTGTAAGAYITNRTLEAPTGVFSLPRETGPLDDTRVETSADTLEPPRRPAASTDGVGVTGPVCLRQGDKTGAHREGARTSRRKEGPLVHRRERRDETVRSGVRETRMGKKDSVTPRPKVMTRRRR